MEVRVKFLRWWWKKWICQKGKINEFSCCSSSYYGKKGIGYFLRLIKNYYSLVFSRKKQPFFEKKFSSFFCRALWGCVHNLVDSASRNDVNIVTLKSNLYSYILTHIITYGWYHTFCHNKCSIPLTMPYSQLWTILRRLH